MAVAAKEKESVGMEKSDLKKRLILAKTMPIHVAFGFDGDGKAVMHMDKIKKGPSIMRDLKQKASDTKNHRFGVVRIDENNPKLCIFTVNKGGGGMARKLVKALKGTGFSKVILQLEDGTIDEQDEEEDETEEVGLNAGSSDDADEQDTEQTETESGDSTDVANPSNSDDAEPDADSLHADLAGLIKEMIAVIQSNPQMKTVLAELATDAQASLKRGDLEQAAAGIEILRQAIADGAPEEQEDAEADDDQTESDTEMSETDDQMADSSDEEDTAEQDASNGGADPSAMMSQLTDLVKRMLPIIAADPSQQDTLRGIAQQAQAGIKGGEHDTAAEHIETLRNLLDSWAPNGQSNGQSADASNGAAPEQEEEDEGPDPAAAAPTIVKARTAWIATRQKVETDLGKLHDAFGSAFKGHGQEEEISKAFRERVETVLHHIDEELAHTLDAVNKANDRAERAKLVHQAHGLLARYQKHVASDQTIAALDSNPFVPMSVQKTLVATLQALSRSIR